MIKSFKCKETARIWEGIRSKRFPSDIHKRAMVKLHMVDVAVDIVDLRNPPSNHLEKLKGDRDEQYSIRINNRYRVCFLWADNNAYDVEIVDYH
ncbi:MAG: type II toxin-antitoxin system RelE/ParE family toxin [Alphaproteobacteria bacterium]|nr:type II toxin-antitoxin system RelE/ParE family toxin [Alphaproteobacteria bacterium]